MRKELVGYDTRVKNIIMRRWNVLVVIGVLATIGIAGFTDQPGLLPYPVFTDVTLDNGLRVLVAENHEQPAVIYRMLVPAGIRDEPRGKEGLAWMTAALLTQETQTMTAEETAKAVDRLGGQLGASVNVEYTIVDCDVLAEDQQAGLDLFAEIILAPSFSKKALGRVRKEILADLKLRYTDPPAMAANHARSLLFGTDHRMGREVTKQSVKGIRARDVQAFYKSHFLPNQSILLAIGDFSADEMLSELGRKFGDWPPGEAPTRVPVSQTDLEELRFRFVHKPDLTQGTIVLCWWGLPSRHPDRPALRLLNSILGGGGFSSRLMTAVRSEAAKTYDIRSGGGYRTDHGYLKILTTTRNEEVVQTYQLIVSEIEKLIRDGVTDEELQKAKSYYSGSLPLGLESPRNIASRVLAKLDQGYSLEEIRREGVRLSEVALDEVNRVANKYLSLEAFVLVIVGDRDELRRPLRTIGQFEEVRYRAPIARWKDTKTTRGRKRPFDKEFSRNR